jgi:hypothetical protein
VPSVSVADNALIAVALLLMEYFVWLHHFAVGGLFHWNGKYCWTCIYCSCIVCSGKVKVVVPVKVPLDQKLM